MDITSPAVLKFKGGLFVLLGLLSGGILILPIFSWKAVALMAISIWSFCRAYYFCFYVMQHYADPSFRYRGLFDLFLHLTGLAKK
jgi:hypothetical protein